MFIFSRVAAKNKVFGTIRVPRVVKNLLPADTRQSRWSEVVVVGQAFGTLPFPVSREPRNAGETPTERLVKWEQRSDQESCKGMVGMWRAQIGMIVFLCGCLF